MFQGSAAISRKKRGNVSVVMFNESKLTGKAHAVHANIELRHAARKAKGRVLLDLSNVEFMSAAFLAVFIELGVEAMRRIGPKLGL